MIQKYTEKRNGQMYQTTITINGNKKGIPLLAKIFGKRESSEDKSSNGEINYEILSISYKRIVYIYKEIITKRIKIEDPYQDAKRYFINDNTIKGSE